jgi:hypothetical protein
MHSLLNSTTTTFAARTGRASSATTGAAPETCLSLTIRIWISLPISARIPPEIPRYAHPPCRLLLVRLRMIDRTARTQLAEAIRALAAGLITNDEFEDRVPSSLDPAVRKVFDRGAWGLYSDTSEYKLVGRHRLPDLARPEIARWVLFLKTDRPYAWPVAGPILISVQVLLAFLTFGVSRYFFHRHFSKHGEVEVWPFIRREHYQEALLAPPYLRGAA